ncbi:MAG: Undecaprenyl-phosphate 4-deoxy-4-formamido-L-arabinose transferase [Chloroflexota bacterium]|jgi:glycosyltransferase involved in cell wall biosynthesis
MTSTPELAVVIPVYNEVHTLATIVAQLRTLPVRCEIIVVDDASCDGTSQVISQLVADRAIRALTHTHNRGKGAAIRSALTLVSAPVVVIQDADLEYDPHDFVAMLAHIHAGADVVYGNRFWQGHPTGMLWSHMLGNRLLTWCFNVVYGSHLRDLETCYKMWRTSTMHHLHIDNDRFDIDPELTAKWIRAGYQIVEVPVAYNGRPYRAGKKIRPKDALSALGAIWRYRKE